MKTSYAVKAGQDVRGTYTKLSRDGRLADGTPLSIFTEEMATVSAPGVLRGLHFQQKPAQAKWVQCLAGRVWDVLVDLRKGQPGYGKWEAIELKFDGPLLYIPAGFAHGFCVLGSEPAVLLYRFQVPYAADGESSLAWNDPILNISWPLSSPQLSERDQQAQSFRAYESSPLGQSNWWEGKRNG